MGLTLTLSATPDVPLEADGLAPEHLVGLSPAEVAAQPLLYGNDSAQVGDFFDVQPSAGEELRLRGDLGKVKLIGTAMSSGRIVIEGKAGLHLGAGMRGGEILLEGDADDWVGPEMSGGRILITGNAGHAVGSAYRGSRVGMRGGEIIVRGKAGNEVGNTMRNGLIAIGGDCGDFAGVNMLAGTILVMGRLGWRCGAGMKRGSIVSLAKAELLPTFRPACSYQPSFLRLYLRYLRDLGLPVEERHLAGNFQRWSGDSVELNRGEVLIFDG